jgi:hypothetical protein
VKASGKKRSVGLASPRARQPDLSYAAVCGVSAPDFCTRQAAGFIGPLGRCRSLADRVETQCDFIGSRSLVRTPLLHVRGEEGVRALLRVLRGLFVIDQVMPENVDGLRKRRREGMRDAGIDDELEI